MTNEETGPPDLAELEAFMSHELANPSDLDLTSDVEPGSPEFTRRVMLTAVTALVALASVGIDLTKPLSAHAVGRFIWPFPLDLVYREYGWRDFDDDKFHKGIDFSLGIAGKEGTAVVSSGSGKVVVSQTGYNLGFGTYVRVDHGGGLTTEYHHLSKLSVAVGQTVSQGQKLGEVGSTGLSTAPHLHFQTNVNGQHMDPRIFMDSFANQGATMTQEQANMLANVYAGIWKGGSVSIGGTVQTFNYGILPIVAHNQTLIAELKTQISTLQASVNELKAALL